MQKWLTGLQWPQRRKLLTFFFFVVISAGFWFVRSLGEVYETDITYPVRYTNFPDNKVLVGEVPDKLKLRVRARGFTILKSSLNLNLIPLKFNVGSFSLNSLGRDTFYVVTESVKDMLSEEFDQVAILDITPDTLFFRFTDMIVKKVAVKPVLAMHVRFFQKQFMQNGVIEVIPDSIIVSGPEINLRDMNYVSTEPISLTNISDTVHLQCKLKPTGRITYSQQEVQVILPVDRFTEVDESLAVVPINVPDSLNMIAIPGRITVTYNICLSNYNRILNNPPLPNIDYLMVQERKVTRLPVFLADTPKFISNIRFNPRETEFLITRK